MKIEIVTVKDGLQYAMINTGDVFVEDIEIKNELAHVFGGEWEKPFRWIVTVGGVETVQDNPHESNNGDLLYLYCRHVPVEIIKNKNGDVIGFTRTNRDEE